MNMVDERFECAAVIFRFAGYWEFGGLELDYQKEVAEVFAKFAEHETVKYAKELDFSYDKVLKFAVHIEKVDGKFVFIEDIQSLFGNWNQENSKKFLELFNKFYIDTNYEEFFNSHMELYEEYTQKFVDETYGKIDFEWFGKYVDPSNLRCIYSLSSGNYGATVNDKIVYCCVFGNGGAVVHEYCHSFGNKLADKWYNENAEFKKWCDDSVDAEKMPWYNSGWGMGCEYIVRAYSILYRIQHGAGAEEWLAIERDFGFIYIREVYNMILNLEEKNETN